MAKVKHTTAPTGTVKERIRLGEKLAYGLGDVASIIVWGSVTGFATYYYTNSAGLAAGAIGTMFLISRILDGISDILFGFILDRTRSKYGKARPWLLWLAVPYGLAAFLLFSVPVGWELPAKLIFAYITYNFLATVVYTGINLAYGTMTALITDDDNDRTQLNVFRMVGAIVSGTIINMVVMPMVNGFGGTPGAWSLTFAILGGVATVLFLVVFAGTKERVGASAAKEDVVPAKVALKALLQNKYWVNRLFGGAVGQLVAATSGVNVFFAAYWLGNDETVGLLTIASFIPMFLALLISAPFVSKIGKRNMNIIGSVIGLAGMILQAINPSSMAFILVGQVLRGIGMGPMAAVGFVMFADVIDYGEWKTGVRSEGLVYSAASVGSKVGAGLGAAILGWALAAGGFNPDLAAQSGAAMTSILAVFVYIPIALQIISIVLLWLYKLDNEMPKIRQELKAKYEANA